jgi:hypothetical protein
MYDDRSFFPELSACVFLIFFSPHKEDWHHNSGLMLVTVHVQDDELGRGTKHRQTAG